MKKNLDITKPRYSEQIFPVPWPFVMSRFHCTTIIWGLIILGFYYVGFPEKRALVLSFHISLLVIGWKIKSLNGSWENIFLSLRLR